MTSPTDITAARDRIAAQRERDLIALAEGRFEDMSSAAPPTPEDLSAQPRQYVMAAMSGVGLAYVREMAAIGRQHGFGVLIHGPGATAIAEGLTAEGLPVSSVNTGELPSSWEEDVGQQSADQVTTLPAARCALVAEHRGVYSEGPELGWIAQGRVACDESGPSELDARIGLALATGRELRMDLGYLERGNVLIGTRGGRLYAMVGRDSMAISRAVIHDELRGLGFRDRTLTEQQLREAVARDIGLSAGDLVVVSQPYAFHIDMAMMPWTDGVVLLNDARRVAEVVADVHGPPGACSAADQRARGFAMVGWRLTRAVVAEQTVAGELAVAGLRVVRAPGRYPDYPSREWIANFFNGEGGTSRDRQRFFVTQDGPAPYRQAYLAALRAQGVVVPRMYYIDRTASQWSLAASGGLNCRAQAIQW